MERRTVIRLEVGKRDLSPLSCFRRVGKEKMAETSLFSQPVNPLELSGSFAALKSLMSKLEDR
jgi:hypothetical protein